MLRMDCWLRNRSKFHGGLGSPCLVGEEADLQAFLRVMDTHMVLCTWKRQRLAKECGRILCITIPNWMFGRKPHPCVQSLNFQPGACALLPLAQPGSCALLPLAPKCGSLDSSNVNELEKDRRNQQDSNCQWQNGCWKHNGNLSPSRAILWQARKVSFQPPAD